MAAASCASACPRDRQTRSKAKVVVRAIACGWMILSVVSLSQMRAGGRRRWFRVRLWGGGRREGALCADYLR